MVRTKIKGGEKMKTANKDRDSVITRQDAICVSLCKRDREIIDQKAKEVGLSRSSFVRMIIKKHIAEN